MQLTTRITTIMLCSAALAFSAARADAAGTCTYFPATNTLNVSLTGGGILAVAATGGIWLNSVPCGSATVTNTQTIYVTGSGSADQLYINITRPFTPGTLPAGGGGDVAEIKFNVDLGGGNDSLFVQGGAADDVVVAGTSGINLDASLDGSGNLTGDSDVDVSYVNVEILELDGNAGNDYLSGAGGQGTGSPLTGRITLSGGDGNDRLFGGGGADIIYGGNGDDIIYGYAGADSLYGGTGNDYVDGGDGNDSLNEDAAFNGNDILVGGAGTDTLYYNTRTSALTIMMDGSCVSGDILGEMDCVQTDIEIVYGGAGDDYIEGNNGANTIYGLGGSDWIDGKGGNDQIYGGAGDDILMGGDGDDSILGEAGNDYLEGGAGTDTLNGGDGNDYFRGGAGRDTMFCGLGADTVLDYAAGSDTAGSDCETR